MALFEAAQNITMNQAEMISPYEVKRDSGLSRTSSDARRLFVTKVPRDSNDIELTRYFGQFGELKDVHVPRIPGAPGHKGIAFITFGDVETAEAVRHKQHAIRGQIMIIDTATERGPSQFEKTKSWDGSAANRNSANSWDSWANNSNGASQWDSWNKRSSSDMSTDAGSDSSKSGEDSWLDSLFNDIVGTEKANTTESWNGKGNSTSWLGASVSGGYDKSYNNKGIKGAVTRTPSWEQQSARPTAAAAAPVGKGPNYGTSIAGCSTAHMQTIDSSGKKIEYVEENNKIFVTKISASLNRDHVSSYFTQFGSLADVYMPTNTGRAAVEKGHTHKGIAFISFSDPAVVREVLSRPQYEILPGTFVVVDKCKTRSKSADAASAGSKGGLPYW